MVTLSIPRSPLILLFNSKFESCYGCCDLRRRRKIPLLGSRGQLDWVEFEGGEGRADRPTGGQTRAIPMDLLVFYIFLVAILAGNFFLKKSEFGCFQKAEVRSQYL